MQLRFQYMKKISIISFAFFYSLSLGAQIINDGYFKSAFKDNSSLCYNKLSKSKEQLLVLYKSGTYSYYCLTFNKSMMFDSGNISLQRWSKKIRLNSIMVSNAFNPFIGNLCQLSGEKILISKSKSVFNIQDSLKSAALIGKFTGKKSYEVKLFANLRVIEKHGYSLDIAGEESRFYQRIKWPDANYYAYCQNFCDSVYSAKSARQINPKYNSVYSLARDIVCDETEDSIKLLLLSSWVVKYFQYDLLGPVDPAELITARRTRCEGYANFFQELCNGVNIPSIRVTGSADNLTKARYTSNTTDLGHAWNLVKVNNYWRPIDVTWLDPIRPDTQSNIVTWDEYYFNPKVDSFVFNHMPKTPPFKLTNLGAKSENEFTESPIIYQQDYTVQYIGDHTNTIVTQNKLLEFVFYSNKKQEISLTKSKGLSQTTINLSTGINIVRIMTPETSGELKFENKSIKLIFYVNKSGNNTKVIKNALTSSNKDSNLYDFEFYQFVSQAIKTKNIIFKSNVDSLDKGFAEWKTVFDAYQGRSPRGSWYIEKGKPVKMRFYFTDLKINGKQPFVECIVECHESQVSMINPEKFPTNNWCFGLR